MGEKKPIVKILPGTVCSKYRLYQKLGSGSFGDIYLAYNLENGEQVAAKVESSNARDPRLEEEFKVYRAIQGGVGIPHIRWLGSGNGMNILVMDLLGPSLEDLFDSCGRMFSLKTVLMLADQMIMRLEWIHNKHHIHRDIKPENLLIGGGCKK